MDITGWMISSDSHLIEPPDLWQRRVDARFRERAPRVIEADGGQWWLMDGQKGLSFAGGAQTGDRFTKPKELRMSTRFEQVRPGGYEPAAHLADNEQDGVWGSVLYPTQGLLLYWQADHELLAECARAYNDWLAEFCGAAPDRLKGIAMLATDDIDCAIAEMTRAKKRGLSGALVPTMAPAEFPYDSSHYEPLWAAAVDLEMPLSMHLGANRAGQAGVATDLNRIRPTYFAICETWVKASIADLIFSGVFDRHPKLKMGVIEHELGWIPFFLDRMDYTHTQRINNANFYRYRTAEKPGDFFRRNVFTSFQDDALGIREREVIGVDGICWGSDYPHVESTFPRSRAIMGARLAGLDAGLTRNIVSANVSRIYGFPGPPAESRQAAAAATGRS